MHCWETMPNNAKEGPLEDEFVIASGYQKMLEEDNWEINQEM